MTTLQKTWKWLKQKLFTLTKAKTCLICFKENSSFLNICDQCLKKMNPKIKHFKINNTHGIGLYPYQNMIQDLLYQYKGCFDISLSKVFFAPYQQILKLLFKNFIIVPIPSYYLHDKRRGFNHVEEIAKELSLPILKCLTKTKNFKQSSLSKHKRKNINQYLKIENIQLLENKNILLIDDVLTSGSTISHCIDLLKTAKVKRIFFIVMSYSCR